MIMDAWKLDEYDEHACADEKGYTGEKAYTMEDIYALPEGSRAELMDGRLYMMASPGLIHQRLSGFLYKKIASYIDMKKGDCEPFAAPFAVFLNADNSIYLEPDISVICDKNKLTAEGCKGAPDWVIEIVSPSSRSLDYVKKLLKYASAGVREYWIADPEKNSIMVYHFAEETMEAYTFSDKAKAGIFEDLEIDFAEINMQLQIQP